MRAKKKTICVNGNISKHLTVCRQMSSDSFKDFTNELFVYKSYIYIYIYISACVCVCEQDLVLNHLQELIGHLGWCHG